MTAFVVSLVSAVMIARTKNTKTSSRGHNFKQAVSDQVKILVSWLQILGRVTRTFSGVPWGKRFSGFSEGAGAPMSLDLQFILSSLGACNLALPFLQKFQVRTLVV